MFSVFNEDTVSMFELYILIFELDLYSTTDEKKKQKNERREIIWILIMFEM